MKMKKILALLLVLTMLFALVACGGGGGGDVLVMGTSADFPPFEFFEGDQIVGLDPDIARAIGDILGYEIEIVDMDFGAIILAVQAGQIDFGMAGMTVTEERLQQVDFTQGYFLSGQSIIVRDDEASVVSSPADLEMPGVRIGIQNATTGHTFADEHFPNAELMIYDSNVDVIQALLANHVDAVILDESPAANFVARNAGRIRQLDERLTHEYYGIALALDSPYTDLFNQALDQLRADGTLDRLIDYWVNENPEASRYESP